MLTVVKLWGGEAKDVVQTFMSEGGHGLGNMGIMRTSWFTAAHNTHQTGLRESLRYTLKEGEGDFHKILDYWAIPVKWQINLFREEFWNDVRKVGSQCTEMGPLTYGSRRLVDSELKAASFSPLTNPGFPDKRYFETPVINDGMTDAEKRYWELEYLRRQHAREILNARYRELLIVQILPLPTHEDSESDTSDEATEEWQCPPCPRWKEISQYLIDNRGPLELALDSMDFDIPEANLYRYIQDCGGLVDGLTPLEFRNFLVYAHTQGRLFE